MATESSLSHFRALLKPETDKSDEQTTLSADDAEELTGGAKNPDASQCDMGCAPTNTGCK